jgi:hypothetical protein
MQDPKKRIICNYSLKRKIYLGHVFAHNYRVKLILSYEDMEILFFIFEVHDILLTNKKVFRMPCFPHSLFSSKLVGNFSMNQNPITFNAIYMYI